MKRRYSIPAAMMLALSVPAFPLDLRDDFSRRLDQGVDSYDARKYDDALKAFQDAAMMKPESYEAAMDAGLAHARSGDSDRAAAQFSKAADLAADNASRRGWALYNRGRAQYDAVAADAEKLRSQGATPGAAAEKVQPPPDPHELIERAAESLSSFDEALAADPKNEAARFNRAQAQHLIQNLAPLLRQSPQNQQQNSGGEKKDGQNNKDDKQQKDQNKQDSQNDQQKDQKQDNQQSQDNSKDPKDQQDQKQDGQKDEQDKNQQGNKDSKDQKDGSKDQQNQKPLDGKADPKQQDKQPQPTSTPGPEDQKQEQAQTGDAGQSDGQPRQMSEAEARRLLNLLGNKETLQLRLPGRANARQPEKDW